MSLKLLETEDGCLTIENNADFVDGVFIHWEIYNWSPSKVKMYKEYWVEIVAALHRRNVKGLYAIPPTEFEEKLIKMFGFKYTGLTYRGYKLMRHE